MPQLTMMELDMLRHFIGEEQLTVNKLHEYLRQCRDPELKAQFQRLAEQGNQTVQRLSAFLR